jgi:hypothetical protein
MRRIVGPVLLFLGAFLIATGLLSKFYIGNALLKTPINVNEVIHLSGSAEIPNAKGKVQTTPVIATSNYLTNTELSDSSVASFENSQCVVKDVNDPVGCPPADDPQHRLLSATTDNFATDRRTAEAVNDPAHLPPGTPEHEGVINKWPFLAEKKTYTYWDDGTQQGVDATYSGTDTLDWHEVYVYDVQVPKTKIEVAAGVKGYYTDDKQVYVDQLTGSVIDQREHQVRTDLQGNPVIDLTIGFTDEQVASLVDDAKTNGQSLKLIRNTLPLVGLVIGVPVFALGLWLTIRNRRRSSGARVEGAEAPKVPAATE